MTSSPMTSSGSSTTLRFARRGRWSAERVEPDEPDVGTRVAGGRYTLIDRLGEGGLGTVFLAEEQATGRQVAIKTLIPRYVGRPDREQRLFDEFAYLQRIKDHDHVVAAIEGGRLAEFDGWPFFVMEYVPGRSLFRYFIQEPSITTAATVGIGLQVARAVQAIHRARVVHRDVTPQNILLLEPFENHGQHRVTVIDFSHAANADGPRLVVGDERRLTKTFEVPGTAQYMPPEQAAVAAANTKMDIYSLGIVLYEMITGRNPFAGVRREDYIELQRQDALKIDPIDPRVYPDLPHSFIHLITRCLRRRPEGRPDIGQIVRRLETIERDVGASYAFYAPYAAPEAPEALPLRVVPPSAKTTTVPATATKPATKPATLTQPLTLTLTQPASLTMVEGEGIEDNGTAPKRKSGLAVTLAAVVGVMATLAGVGFLWKQETVQGHDKGTEATRAQATRAHNKTPDIKPDIEPDIEPEPKPRVNQGARRLRPRRPNPKVRSPADRGPTISECEDTVAAANSAWRDLRSSDVLLHTSARACWAEAPIGRLALRAEALMDLGRWSECVRLGQQSQSPKVQRWTTRCEKRLESLEDTP
jgi:serine/threonine protein kinase